MNASIRSQSIDRSERTAALSGWGPGSKKVKRNQVPLLHVLGFCLAGLSILVTYPLDAQNNVMDGEGDPIALTSHNVVPWVGSAPQLAGKTVRMNFSLFKDSMGGPSLWNEMHTVKPGIDGHFTVLLGALTPDGLPQSLFQTGEINWIDTTLVPDASGALPAGETDTSEPVSNSPRRTLLTAVPYAFKSIDAETLNGRPATDYVTLESLHSTIDQALASMTIMDSLSGGPKKRFGILSQMNPTLNQVPLWIEGGALGSSTISQIGLNVGIGTTTPATILDVNGSGTFRAALALVASVASIGAGVDSPALQLQASAYSSASGMATPQNFAWVAQSAQNNTANPSANLSLLFGSGSSVPSPTGLSIAPNGLITFASGQSFPGLNTAASGAGNGILTGVTAGSGLSGGGVSGNVTLALSGPVEVANGGTGAANPAVGLSNLNGISSVQASPQSMAGPLSAPVLNQVFVISPNSKNDLAVPINAALSACSPTLGCKIEIAPLAGPATLSGPIVISQNRVALICDSPVKMSTHYANTPLAPSRVYYYGPIDISGNNVEVAGCALDVSSLGRTGLNAIHVYGASQVRVHGNVITSSVTPKYPGMLGIRVEGPSGSPASYVDIYDNSVTVPSISFSVGDNSQHVTFHDNYSLQSFQCFDFNGSGGGVVPDAFGIKFHDNSCVGDTGPSYAESARDVTIQNNNFFQDSTTGAPTIRVHNTLTSNPSLHVVIDGNTFVGNSSTTTAAEFFQNAQDWQFINNHVRNYGTDGVTVTSTSGTPLYGIIANNQFIDNGQQGGPGNYCGIRLHQKTGNNVGFVSITGNMFTDDQGKSPTEIYPICSDGGQAPFNILYTGNFNGLSAPPSFPSGCNNCVRSSNFGGSF
jgi:hypothetical protein